MGDLRSSASESQGVMNFIAIIVIVVLTVLFGGCVWYLYKNMDALIGDSQAGDTSRGAKKATEKTGLLGSKIDSWGGNSEEDKKLLGGGHASEAENKRLANL